MFPEIVKSKKKARIGTQQMQKQCQIALRQLQFKHKKALKWISPQLASDFHKVCHLKDIPTFYWQYFFYFVSRANPQQMQNHFAQEVENIMLSKSYYHRISSLIKDRPLLLSQMKQQMQIVQGFSIMNSGKQLPFTLKGKINSLINNCSSLEQLKSIESSEVDKFAQMTVKVRDNMKEIVEMVISWQFWLRSFCSENEPVSVKRMKVIFPENGVNSIFIGLYDTQFLKISSLTQEAKFFMSQNDPFLLHIQPTKKSSKIFQQHFITFLQSSSGNYKKVQKYVLDCIPTVQKAQNNDKVELKRAATSQKRLIKVQRPISRDRKRSEPKLVNEFLSVKLIVQKDETKKNQQQTFRKQINIDQMTSVYKKKRKFKNSSILIEGNNNLQRSLSKSKSRSVQSVQQKHLGKSLFLLNEKQPSISSPNEKKGSRKSLQKVDQIQKSMSKTQNNMKKIQNVYKLSSPSKKLPLKKITSSQPNLKIQLDVQKVIKQKQQLLKELNKQKKEQQTLKKIIKQVQHRTSSENRNYQEKTQRYQKEIQLLKSRIKDRQEKYQKSPKNDKQKSSKLITKVYENKSNPQENNLMKEKQLPQKNLTQSQLIEQRNSNKLMENKIKQLIKEKVKLEKLIEKQGSKINKEKQVYERKLQKYQEMIGKLKNQANQSKNQAIELQKKWNGAEHSIKEKEKQDKLLKLYTKRQTSSVQKLQRLKKVEQKPIRQEKSKQLKVVKNQISNQSSKKELLITNGRNTIQIVYNRKKDSKEKKEAQKLSQNNQSVQKQRQFQYQKQMSLLIKQKSLLERKLDMRKNQKSGQQTLLMKKLQQTEGQVQKYRQMMEKEKQRSLRYDERIKEVRKKINEDYEQKMQRQRQRFEEQKQKLFRKLKDEKEQKMEKDKHLSKQMIFLKEMQKREQELILMLENQKIERLERERRLEEEITQKQQILQQYELDQIKRVIQKQVREEMNLLNSEEEIQRNQDKGQQRGNTYKYESRKQEMENEIQQMMEMQDLELKEMDQENQKLKELIYRIKEEEKKVIVSLQNDIFQQKSEQQLVKQRQNHALDVESDYNHDAESIIRQRTDDTIIKQLFNANPLTTRQNELQNSRSNQRSYHNPQNQSQRNSRMVIELQYKSELQLEQQRASHFRYNEIELSPAYKEREKLENIIEQYLKNPHHYPTNDKPIVMNPKEQKDMVEEITQNNRKAKEFQQQLMDLKHVQSFVPAERDDPIMSHMLNLRHEYENQESESLRKLLFPAIWGETENQNENLHQLSFESQQPPQPVTLHDHVKIHQDQYLKQRKDKKLPSKNFMAINRMKLLQIEQEKKEKQRQLIQEESKKKVRKIKYKARKKEEKELIQFNQIKKEIQEKEKKRQGQLKRTIQKRQEANKKDGKNVAANRNQNEKQQNGNKKQQKHEEQKMDDGEEKNEFLFLEDDQNRAIESDVKLMQSSKQGDKKQKQLNEVKDISEFDKKKAPDHINGGKKQAQQEKAEQLSEEYNDQQFQDEAQSEQNNEFIPPQSEPMKQLQAKLGQLHRQEESENPSNNQQPQISNQNLQQFHNQNQLQPSQLQSQNIALMKLQHQRQSLKQDLLSYQDEIRSYISSNSHYNVYQHFIEEKHLTQYIKEILQLSSQQIISLNHNQSLEKDLPQTNCLNILIAKNTSTQLQIGIGLFHKEFSSGEYICDYLLVHDMKNLLSLTFNFTRFIYQKDQHSSSVQFIFTRDGLYEDENSNKSFGEFQEKCKRLGEIYVKGKEGKTRKYVLKRELFQLAEREQRTNENKGITFNTKIQMHSTLMKQRNEGYHNSTPEAFTSPTFLLSLYLKNNPQLLEQFKSTAQHQLKFRQILLTSMVFAKKQFTFNGVENSVLKAEEKMKIYQSGLEEKFVIDQNQKQIEEMNLFLQQQPTKGFKRCLLQINDLPINYCLFSFQQALNRCQASNSSQIGTFLPLIPKFKILIIPAQQFLTSSSSNADTNVFFYTKHFIKNITEIKKENVSRVFLPQIKLESQTFYKELSQKLKKTVLGKERIQLGFENKLSNSVLYTPRHNDLVIERPFILSVLSANVERAIQGTPIFCKLVQ